MSINMEYMEYRRINYRHPLQKTLDHTLNYCWASCVCVNCAGAIPSTNVSSGKNKTFCLLCKLFRQPSRHFVGLCSITRRPPRKQSLFQSHIRVTGLPSARYSKHLICERRPSSERYHTFRLFSSD